MALHHLTLRLWEDFVKDFDRVELGAVRKMEEVDHWFKRNGGIACRQEIHDTRKEKIKAWWRRIMMKEGKL